MQPNPSAADSANRFALIPGWLLLLGGVLLTWLGWRGLFLVLAVFGVACLAALYRRLPESHDTRHAEPLVLGNVLGAWLSLAILVRPHRHSHGN